MLGKARSSSSAGRKSRSSVPSVSGAGARARRVVPTGGQAARPQIAPFIDWVAEPRIVEAVVGKTAAMQPEEVGWVGRLIALYCNPNGPPLPPGSVRDEGLAVIASRDFPSALDMALAYTLPGFSPLRLGDAASKVRKLRSLRFSAGGVAPARCAARAAVFEDPIASGRYEELAERLGELAEGLFDDALVEGGQLIDRERHVWLTPRAVPAEEAAEKTKFLQLGRMETKAMGPPCPNCKSRNTAVVTMQLRSNDEAQSNQLICHNCGVRTTLM